MALYFLAKKVQFGVLVLSQMFSLVLFLLSAPGHFMAQVLQLS